RRLTNQIKTSPISETSVINTADASISHVHSRPAVRLTQALDDGELVNGGVFGLDPVEFDLAFDLCDARSRAEAFRVIERQPRHGEEKQNGETRHRKVNVQPA